MLKKLQNNIRITLNNFTNKYLIQKISVSFKAVYTYVIRGINHSVLVKYWKEIVIAIPYNALKYDTKYDVNNLYYKL